MVTYHCSSCGDYLKKQQGIKHTYCSQDLTCTICKTEVRGANQVKLHQCPTEEKKKSEIPKKLEGIDSIEFKGFKNTLRKVVKIQKDKKAEKSQLKKVMEKILWKNEVKIRNFEQTFERKLKGAKNLVEKDNEISYQKSL